MYLSFLFLHRIPVTLLQNIINYFACPKKNPALFDNRIRCGRTTPKQKKSLNRTKATKKRFAKLLAGITSLDHHRVHRQRTRETHTSASSDHISDMAQHLQKQVMLIQTKLSFGRYIFNSLLVCMRSRNGGGTSDTHNEPLWRESASLDERHWPRVSS